MTQPVPMNAAAKPKPERKPKSKTMRKPLRPPRKLRLKRKRALPLRADARHAPIRWTLCRHRLCRRRRCCVLPERCINPRTPWRDRLPVYVERVTVQLIQLREQIWRRVAQLDEERARSPSS